MTSAPASTKPNSQSISRPVNKVNNKAKINHRPGWFSPLLAQKPLARSHHFMVHVLLCQNHALLLKRPASTHFDPQFSVQFGAQFGAQFGVLVPKKLVRRAVDRNAIKRIARAQWLENLAASVQAKACSARFMVLVRFTKPVTSVPYIFKHKLKQEMKSLFSEISEKLTLQPSLESKHTCDGSSEG